MDDMVELESGPVVMQDEMRHLASRLEIVYKNKSLAKALEHLSHSWFLFYGHMTGSYYWFHYRHDRAAVSKYQMAKRYYENRERYELAFLSEFKGIEAFLGKQIKKENVVNLLEASASDDITPQTIYSRLHEVYSGEQQEVTYEDIIFHFLTIRNVVGAHSNASPPDDRCTSEDSVFEIQALLSELCVKLIRSAKPRRLPTAAILAPVRT